MSEEPQATGEAVEDEEFAEHLDQLKAGMRETGKRMREAGLTTRRTFRAISGPRVVEVEPEPEPRPWWSPEAVSLDLVALIVLAFGCGLASIGLLAVPWPLGYRLLALGCGYILAAAVVFYVMLALRGLLPSQQRPRSHEE